MKVSKLGAKATCCGSWFQILMVLRTKEYIRAFNDDCGARNFMLCPLVALAVAGFKNVDGMQAKPTLFSRIL